MSALRVFARLLHGNLPEQEMTLSALIKVDYGLVADFNSLESSR